MQNVDDVAQDELLQNLCGAIDCADLGLLVLDSEARLCAANRQARGFLGAGEGTARRFPELLEALGGANGRVLERKGADGPRAFKVSGSPVRGGRGAMLVVLTDVTEEWRRVRAHAEARQWVDRARDELGAYKRALRHHTIVGITDRSGRITYVNEKFCEISKYSREELIGQRHDIINSGHHPRSFFIEMWKTIAGGAAWKGEICNRARDGSLYWVDTTIVPLASSAGVIEGYVSMRYDITARKQADAALHEENRRRREAETLLREVIETVPDAIVAYDPADRLILFNAAYRQVYDRDGGAIAEGADFEQVLRRCVANGQFAMPSSDWAGVERWVGQRIEEHRNPGRTLQQQLWDGRWLQIRERRSPAGFVVGVRTDITAVKQAERTIKEQAERDHLTGLYNRSVLIERLDRLRRRAPRAAGPSGALVVIDIDHFKDINDTLGHGCGDEMLTELARRLTEAVRATDTVARLGGDEFAILLTDTRSEEAVRRLLARVIARLREPVVIGGRQIQPSASLGISLFPRDGRDAIELLRSADIALYSAKAQGRGRSCFFDAPLRERLERRETVAAGLRAAVEENGISVVYQPQFTISDARHEGFELLARWENGPLKSSPAEFIPIAEETGLIVPLGQHVFEAGLAQMCRLRALGLAPGRLAVNVAAAQLKLDGFPALVASLLQRYRLPASAIEIEVTETVLLDRAAEAIGDALAQFHRMGVQIALDDFGTGHASLSHLKSFHVDRLKIDRSFVGGIGVDRGDEIIVRTIVNLAHSLGKTVVAEGIETHEQWRMLRELGCDTGQGYIVSRPLPGAEAEGFLAGGAASAA